MLLRLFFPEQPTEGPGRYLFALACCAAALGIRILLDPVLQEHSPLLFFTLSVAVSAMRGGFEAGLVSTVVGALAAEYFFPPVGTFKFIESGYLPTAISQIVAFLIVGLVLSWLSSELRRLRSQALDVANQRNEILESITDGFQALDASGRFLYLNRVAAQFAQSPRESLAGRRFWDVVPDLRGTIVESKFREVLERRQAVHFEYLHSSSNRWYEFHAHPARYGGLTAYFRDITDRKATELQLRRTLEERNAALENVRLLSGLLPICAGCKKIRDDHGSWQQMESYISDHSQARFSHGMCPDCARVYFGELAEEPRK
jgi:PAS domain S-box-containing protein